MAIKSKQFVQLIKHLAFQPNQRSFLNKTFSGLDLKTSSLLSSRTIQSSHIIITSVQLNLKHKCSTPKCWQFNFLVNKSLVLLLEYNGIQRIAVSYLLGCTSFGTKVELITQSATNKIILFFPFKYSQIDQEINSLVILI